ncbi:glutathione peroxidase [Mariprofundus erugo]|nr:glutathione peroxidase [Mariprofundus erugo]
MKSLLLLLLMLPALACAQACPPLLDQRVETLDEHEPVQLCERYAGKVLLIVNTASRCMFTPQYEGLESLYEQYREEGLVVLGFPSNDFGNQEPGSEAEVKQFCSLTYEVKFPMFSKTTVIGNSASPLYRELAAAAGEAPGWNFHKYLIGRDGRLIDSFASNIKPQSEQLQSAIRQALAQ